MLAAAAAAPATAAAALGFAAAAAVAAAAAGILKHSEYARRAPSFADFVPPGATAAAPQQTAEIVQTVGPDLFETALVLGRPV
eukprot:COSAG02_NODE_7_length_64539_cov_120.393482_5_plen_83_part_00